MKPPINNLPRGVLVTVSLSIIVLVSFAIFTASIGGDALDGKIENGHYFVRQGAPYKEVSFFQYIISAFLCLMASVAFFLLGNRVLYVLEIVGILKSKSALRICLNIFFGGICGSVFLYSIFIILHSLAMSRG